MNFFVVSILILKFTLFILMLKARPANRMMQTSTSRMKLSKPQSWTGEENSVELGNETLKDVGGDVIGA
jgi:hypothetical protein